jgi:UDP-glucose:(heptosyl)LPS alpha-1,3-glucosyltransferase
VEGPALRIALICGTFGAGQGTGGQSVALATGLLQRGHHVEVWARRVDDTAGVVVHQLPRSRRALWAAVQRVPRERFDVVHALERVPGADVYRAGGGVHLAWLQAAPPALWDRRLTMRHRREAALCAAAARTARRVVANSLRSAGQLAAWHGVEHQRLRVVRNGVALDRFAPDPGSRARVRAAWGVSDGARVALFLGHDGPRKGLEVAAAAFRQVARGEDVLLAAGPRQGPPGVRCLGPVPASDVLAGADAMVLPSRYDASSNAVLEALAAGVPPVCSAADGASEVVPDRRLVVADPLDVHSVAEALGYAWRSADGGRMRAAAEAWPVSRMVRDTETVYREL